MAREISISFALNAALGAGFKAAFQTASQSARNVATAIRDMEKSPVGHLGAAMAQQREKIKGLAGSLKEARATLASLQSQAQASGGATRLLATQIEQAEARVRNLNGALARQRGLMLNTAAQAATTCGSVSQLGREYASLTRQIERAGKVRKALNANRAQGEALRNQRADLNSRLAGTVATATTVALPVKLAISAEDTFADLRKVMDAPEEEMQAVFAAAQQMSNRTGKSFEDVVTIMTAAAQAGLGKTKEQLLGVADQAVKMSIAWGVSAETAGKSLANWQSSMGLTADQSRHTADVINALSNEMNAEAGEINNIFTRMGAMMKSSGMATQDIAALATAFKAAGAQVEVSGTAMKNFTNVLAAGSAGMTDAKLNVFKYLEIDPDELQKQFYQDAKGAILRVLNALKNNVRPEELNSIAGTAFGQESIAAISPLIDQIDTLTTAFKIANSEVSGSVDDEYANRMKTTATAIGQATQSMRNLGVTTGNALLPAVGFVAKGISGLVSIVDGFVKTFPNLSSGVMIAGAAFAALAVGSLMFGLVLNTVKSGVNSVAGVLLRLVASQVATTASTGASAGAMGIFGVASRIAGAGAKFFAGGLRSILVASGVGALLVGLGFAINLLIDNWDAVANAMTAAWGWVKDTWGRLGVFFSELGKNLADVFAPVWDGICGAASWAWNGVVGIWSGITGFFAHIWDGVANGATSVWDWITAAATWAWNGVSGVWQGVVEFFGGIGQGISDSFSGVWEGIVAWANWAWEGIAAIWTGVSAFFGGIVDSIFGVFTGLFNWLKDKFAWVFSAIDAVSSAVGSITGAVKGAWNKAFGDGEKKDSAGAAAPAANGQKAAPAANRAAGAAAARPPAPKMPEKPATASQAKTPPAGPNFKPGSTPAQAATAAGARPSYGDWLKEQEAAKKAAKGSGSRKSSGGGRKAAGGSGGGSRASSSAGSGTDKKSGPVTVVTLDSGNEIKTQYFPAATRNAAGNAVSAQPPAAQRPLWRDAPIAGAAGQPRAYSGQQDTGFFASAASVLKSSGIGGVIGQGLTAGLGMVKSLFGGETGAPEGKAQAPEPKTTVIAAPVVKTPVAQTAPLAAAASRTLRQNSASTLQTSGQPALPRAPALLAKKQGRPAKEAQPGQIAIDLTQNFDLITQDAAAARKVLEAIKPDMEALIRRALAKIQSDRSRTAYAQ